MGSFGLRNLRVGAGVGRRVRVRRVGGCVGCVGLRVSLNVGTGVGWRVDLRIGARVGFVGRKVGWNVGYGVG